MGNHTGSSPVLRTNGKEAVQQKTLYSFFFCNSRRLEHLPSAGEKLSARPPSACAAPRAGRNAAAGTRRGTTGPEKKRLYSLFFSGRSQGGGERFSARPPAACAGPRAGRTAAAGTRRGPTGPGCRTARPGPAGRTPRNRGRRTPSAGKDRKEFPGAGSRIGPRPQGAPRLGAGRSAPTRAAAGRRAALCARATGTRPSAPPRCRPTSRRLQ